MNIGPSRLRGTLWGISMLLVSNILLGLGVIGLIIFTVLLLMVLVSNLAHALGAHVPDYKATLKAFCITTVVTTVIWVLYIVTIANLGLG